MPVHAAWSGRKGTDAGSPAMGGLLQRPCSLPKPSLLTQLSPSSSFISTPSAERFAAGRWCGAWHWAGFGSRASA